MLPDGSGEIVLRWVRENLGWDVPVVFVTARDVEEDVVKVLRQGADDYVVKPPKMLELLARIEALGRRSRPLSAPTLRMGCYEVRQDAREIHLAGEPVELTQKEFNEKSQKSKVLSAFGLILFFFLSFSFSYSQVFSENDVVICNSKFQLAVDKNLAEKPIGDIIVEVGKSFIATDYLAYGLENDGDEELVINVAGLDCTTFLENSLVLARCIKKGTTSFEEYMNELQLIRNREGVIDQYPSRLHYFSDWIYDNVKKGIVKDITEEIGGKKIKFKLDRPARREGPTQTQCHR